MIVIQVEVAVAEGTLEKVRGALRRMEQASRAEPGCLVYAFTVDVNDPTMVRVVERWASMEALQAHFASPHMAEFQQAVAALEPRALDVKAFEVAREVELPGR